VTAGVQAVGHVNPLTLDRRSDGAPPVLLLAGRTWVVEHIDWRRRRTWVRETVGKGLHLGREPERFFGGGGRIRSVLAGAEAGAELSAAARAVLERSAHPWAREGQTALVALGDGDDRWWTFAGLLANAEVAARLGGDTAPESLWLRVPPGTSAADLHAALGGLGCPGSPVATDGQDGGQPQVRSVPPSDPQRQHRPGPLADPETVERCLAEPVATWTV
jgi:ATP-dependent Lhr-like helicase